MERPLTGRMVFAIIAAMFGTIIAVNLTLAVKAVRTFPGLEVKNSYVASQGFDARRKAQEALGWSVDAAYDSGRISVVLLDKAGVALTPASLTVVLGRPTTDAWDRTLDLDATGSAMLTLAPGLWRVDVGARAADGTPFEKRLTLRVRP